MEIKTIRKRRELLPGLDMTQEEFMARVRKGEEGPFYTLDEIKQKMNEFKALRKEERASSMETTGSPFPTWKEMQQIREERTSRYGFDPATESGTLTNEQLTDMIRETEQGPFYTLEDGKRMMQQWREQRQNR